MDSLPLWSRNQVFLEEDSVEIFFLLLIRGIIKFVLTLRINFYVQLHILWPHCTMYTLSLSIEEARLNNRWIFFLQFSSFSISIVDSSAGTKTTKTSHNYPHWQIFGPQKYYSFVQHIHICLRQKVYFWVCEQHRARQNETFVTSEKLTYNFQNVLGGQS